MALRRSGTRHSKSSHALSREEILRRAQEHAKEQEQEHNTHTSAPDNTMPLEGQDTTPPQTSSLPQTSRRIQRRVATPTTPQDSYNATPQNPQVPRVPTSEVPHTQIPHNTTPISTPDKSNGDNTITTTGIRGGDTPQDTQYTGENNSDSSSAPVDSQPHTAHNSGTVGAGTHSEPNALGSFLSHMAGRLGNDSANRVANGLARANQALRNGIEATKRTLNRIANTAHNVVQFFINTWIIWVAILAILAVILGGVTVSRTFGLTQIDCTMTTDSGDTSSSSSSNGNSGTGVGGYVWTKEGTEAYNNAKAVWDYWVNKHGFSGAGAAGIIGNIGGAENTGFVLDKHEVGGGSGGGLYQFTPYTKYLNHPASDKSWSAENQSEVVWQLEFKNNAIAKYGLKKSALDLAQSTDPAEATVIFERGYERPNMAVAHEDKRIQAAKVAYEVFGGASVNFDQAKWDAGGGSDQKSTTGTTGSTNNSASDGKCSDQNGGNTFNGSTKDFKSCDKGGCTFDWMCESAGVCKNGDNGKNGKYAKYVNWIGSYQCVWYAWLRLGMLHGDVDGWSPILGNGGDIWALASSKAGWTADTTPHVGDGMSGHAKPFAAGTHIAVVEKVESDPSGWKIYISEGNVGGSDGAWNTYHTRWMTKDQALKGDNHFFRYNGWNNK